MRYQWEKYTAERIREGAAGERLLTDKLRKCTHQHAAGTEYRRAETAVIGIEL